MEIYIEVTKSGKPAAWEWGGGHARTGQAQVIADCLGLPKRPIFERRRGHLALGEHALVPLAVGDHVIRAVRGQHDEIVVWVVKEVDVTSATAKVAEVASYENGEWSQPLPGFLEAAVTAAVEKSQCYHCRSAHFIQR